MTQTQIIRKEKGPQNTLSGLFQDASSEINTNKDIFVRKTHSPALFLKIQTAIGQNDHSSLRYALLRLDKESAKKSQNFLFIFTDAALDGKVRIVKALLPYVDKRALNRCNFCVGSDDWKYLDKYGTFLSELEHAHSRTNDPMKKERLEQIISHLKKHGLISKDTGWQGRFAA